MNNNKTKIKTKKYIKAGLVSNLTKYKKKQIKPNKLAFFAPDFVYLNSKTSNKIKNNFKNRFNNRRRFKLFFGFLKMSTLKKYLVNDLPKLRSSIYSLKEKEFCSLLERRLGFLLFRLGLVKTLFEAKHLVAYKKIFVNGVLSKSYAQRVKKGDIITFSPSVKKKISQRLLSELVNRNFFFHVYDNLEINLKTLNIIVVTEKIKLSNHLQHYSTLLNWKNF